MRHFLAAGAAIVFCLAFTSRAYAHRDSFTIEVGGGYHMVSDDGIPGPGLGGDLWLTYGLTNHLTLRAFGGYATHPSRDGITTAGLDAVYMLEAFAFVPYVGVGVDGVLHHRDVVGTRSGFGVHGVVGLDILLSDAFHVGLEVRPTFVLTQFFEMPIYLKVAFALDTSD